MNVASRDSLSPNRRRLMELIGRIHYGRIENLSVRGGEPVLEPMPRVVREVKFGGHRATRPAANGDFLVKDQVADLFAHFDQLGNGMIKSLEIKDGLPFRMSMEEAA